MVIPSVLLGCRGRRFRLGTRFDFDRFLGGQQVAYPDPHPGLGRLWRSAIATTIDRHFFFRRCRCRVPILLRLGLYRVSGDLTVPADIVELHGYALRNASLLHRGRRRKIA